MLICLDSAESGVILYATTGPRKTQSKHGKNILHLWTPMHPISFGASAATNNLNKVKAVRIKRQGTR
jgi:hypothetical protein